MYKKGFFRDKKGEGENMIDSPVIFLILNILFFSILLLFIFKQSTGAFVYEQAYAKQITLLLDSARPGMTIYVNFEKGIEAANKNNFDINNAIKIDDENNAIIVKLSKRGGFATKYFTDYGLDYKIEENYLIINVRDKTEEEKIKTKIRVITQKYAEKEYDFDFVPREQTDIEKAILFAKENQVGGRRCYCENNCVEYAEYIIEASKNNQIDDPLLLLALMMQESSCKDYDKCNFAGYCGLMQIPKKISGWADPKTNINEGARIFREKYDIDKNGKVFQGCSNRNIEYKGWNAALRGYNGWGCGKDAKGNLLYSQDSFVEDVLDIYNDLKTMLNENAK